jgi:hypothetical protein
LKCGDRVGVRHGVRDEGHPDIPLGGWTGTIFKIHKRSLYSVRWSQKTLASIHPIYKRRCAIDGEVLEEYYLREEDLESDPGGPLAIEQPTQITPRPLSAKNQGDRVRTVFGLTSDDLLPAVDEDSLETYYDHLAQRMSLPVEAQCCLEVDFFNPAPLRWGKVVALDREIAWDEDVGILCKIHTAEGEEKVVPVTDLKFRRSDPNHHVVDDFSAWYFHELSCYEDDWDDDDWDDDEDAEEDTEPEDDEESELAKAVTWRSVIATFLGIITFAVTFGAFAGSAVAVMSWARWAACIGGGAWATIEAVAHVRHARKAKHLALPAGQMAATGIIMVLAGALHGTMLGIMAVAFIGAVLGGIAGAILRSLIGAKKWLVLCLFPKGMFFAAACGVTAQAFYLDHASATTGLEYGALLGLASGMFLCLIALPIAASAVRVSVNRA